MFVINDKVNSETGVRPFDARFGRIDGPYLKLPENALPEEITHEWIKQLDDKLRTVWSISSEYQAKLVKERVKQTPEERRNVYHPGELVLLQRDPSQHLPTKLSMHFTGPWEVIKHESNAVEIRHIATHEIRNVHVTRLKMYHGGRAAGYKTALRDADQYVVVEILAWRGTVTERSCLWVKVHYADGDILWQEWSRDLDNSAAYSNFIHREKPLYLLRFKAHIADRETVALNKQTITEVEPGDSVYVDLRARNSI